MQNECPKVYIHEYRWQMNLKYGDHGTFLLDIVLVNCAETPKSATYNKVKNINWDKIHTLT